MRLTVGTYNIHKCVGRDGQHSPERITEVLRELRADILAIQEFDNRARHRRPEVAPEDLSLPLGMHCIAQPTMEDPDGGFHGNLLMSRHPISTIRHVDLGRSGPEIRRAILAMVELRERPVAVVATHLGLSFVGRRRQSRVLINAVSEFADQHPVILLGDFNEWLPVGGCHAILARQFDGGDRLSTFPTRAPMLPLDRIWVSGALRLAEMRVHRTQMSEAASDHLPLVADVLGPSMVRSVTATRSPGREEISTMSP